MGLDIYINEIDEANDVTFEFAYFRKFNALHSFMETEYDIDNLESIDIDLDMIDKLKAKMDIVLSAKDQADGKDIAEQTFPTGIGFFFGSDEYGEQYYEDCDMLQSYVFMLDDILSKEDNTRRFVYHAWY